ncbi:galactose-binding domain-like protein [Xylariomycetidae sp. FL2044]|nr:galactose-binding domain-like protein [Xylariomycetidae sp. FL2044]
MMRSSICSSLWTVGALLGGLTLGYEVKTPPLDTDWTYSVGTDPWPEYPRPQLQRSEWKSLNGIWKWGAADNAADAIPAQSLGDEILVPSSWYSTEFAVPTSWDGQSILLNFEAVDYQTTAYVNGQIAGVHTGGYWHFNFDITRLLTNGTNKLDVHVFDPTDLPENMPPVGKQTRSPSHIFYTACTGIWGSVWIEPVPSTYIEQFDVSAGADGIVNVTVTTARTNVSVPVKVSVIDESGDVIATGKGSSNRAFEFHVDSPHLWSPDSPHLYNLTVTAGQDKATSYTGFRTYSIGEIDGVLRPLINGEFIFQFGTLDQGFWPDGI